MIALSIMNTTRMLGGDKTIKHDPAKAVLGIRIGDNVKPSADDFAKLATAFFSMRSSENALLHSESAPVPAASIAAVDRMSRPFVSPK